MSAAFSDFAKINLVCSCGCVYICSIKPKHTKNMDQKIPILDPQVAEWIRTELKASKWVMGFDDESARVHNAALERAIRLVNDYSKGDGLFQIGQLTKRKSEPLI